MNKKRRSFLLIASHAIETLPSHFGKRIELLGALVDVLPLDSDLRARAAILLTQLEDHESSIREMQRELPLMFGQGNLQKGAKE